MRKRFELPLAIVILLLAVSPALAGRGGKGKPGGGGEPPADPAIVYTERGDLKVMNADGSNQATVLAGQDHRWPAWSADGSRLLFSSDVAGLGIYTVALDGSDLTKIVAFNAGMTRARWSPLALGDGQFKIAFSDVVIKPDGSPGEFDIFLINPDGTGLVNLTNTADRSESLPTWAPDAGALAYVQYHESSPGHVDVDLMLVTLDASVSITSTTNLTEPSTAPGSPLNARHINVPTWERSGDRIAVSVLLNGVRDVWAIDVQDPAHPVNISNDASMAQDAPTWSPAGDRIVCVGYGGQRRRDSGLYVLDVSSGELTQLVSSTNVFSPSWRP